MSITVTPENAHTFVGRAIELNFGAYCPTHEAVIVRAEIIAGTKFFPASAILWTTWTDEDGEVVDQSVTSFVTDDDVSGIGARLL